MSSISTLISTHGYWVVAATIGLESMGVPVPGETMLVTAAIYAGVTHHLSIALVIVSAAAGAIVGDNVGFLLGRRFGYPLLLRYGHLVKITPPRIKVGEFLFQRHGGKVVFFGRFVAVLRALAALLAGVNCMSWSRFLLFNAAGGVAWAATYGTVAYVLGKKVEHFTKPVAMAFLAVAVVGMVALIVFVRRHEAELQAEAERAIPGSPGPGRRG